MFYVMLAINALYVLAEFLFNFILLNTASADVKLDDIHSVEIIGRSLAAFGFTFIFWKLIQNKNMKTLKKVFLMLAVSLVAYPSFYFGQERLVNSLANNASVETREKLHDLFLLKQGLISGALQLDSIPYNTEIKDLPESKTFVSNISLFLLDNSAVHAYMQKNRLAVATNIFKNDVVDHTDKYLDIYNNATLQISEMYKAYHSNNEMRRIDINKAVNGVDDFYPKMEEDLKWYYKKARNTNQHKGQTYQEFTNTDSVKDMVIQKIKEKKSIRLDRNFDPSNVNSVKNAFARYVYNKYEEGKAQFKKENGFILPEGLDDRYDFFMHPTVVNKAKEAMGAYYVEEIYRHYASFFAGGDTSVLIRNNADKVANAVAQDFVKQDLMSEQVTSVVKAMIVPPIALFLSLLFAFINIFILIKSIIKKVLEHRMDPENVRRYSNVIVGVLIAALFMFPATLTNTYTESPAYQKVYTNMKENGTLVAMSVNWIMKLEPYVYESGSTFINDNFATKKK